MCAAGLEPCLFKRILELSPLRQVLFRMGIHCASGSLDAEWLQAIQNLLGDGAINPSAPERDAIAGTHLVGGAAASVALRWTALAAVADRELSPAASASQKSRQQGFAPANRTAAHVALTVGVVADQPLIPFKLCPCNIALMVVLDQNLPIIPAAMQAARDPFSSVLTLPPPTAPAKSLHAPI